MAIDPNVLVGTATGLAIGTGVHFWLKKSELQQRCEFISYLERDMRSAFKAVDKALSSSETPKTIRAVLLGLLTAHADDRVGARVLDAFRAAAEQGVPANDNPLTDEMQLLVQKDPDLARDVHHAMASLFLGLIFLNHADNIRVEKVQEEVARDPVSLWSRIERMFTRDHDHTPGSRPAVAA